MDLSEDIEASNVTLDLTRPVELPFMPTVGMTFEGVFWVNEEDAFDNDLCKITHVYFSLVTGRFDCRVDSAGPWPKDSPFTFEDAASFVESGCLLDGESDPREWAKKAESRGDRIPGYRRDGEP